MGLQIPRGVYPQAATEGAVGKIRPQLGAIFHALARQKECHIIERHLKLDHVHVCIAIPPKHPVASVIGFLKGKSAIAVGPTEWPRAELSSALARNYQGVCSREVIHFASLRE